MPELDLIVGGLWIAALTAVLLGQAVAAWLRYRHAARFARHAAKLAAATRPSSEPAARPDLRLVASNAEAGTPEADVCAPQSISSKA